MDEPEPKSVGMSPSTLREAYARDGVVRVPNAVNATTLDAMREALCARLDDLEWAEVAGAMRPAVGTELGLWAVGRDPCFGTLPADFMGAVERVFGPGAWVQVEGEQGGLAMPNRPCPEVSWTACAEAWHVDEPTPPGQNPSDVLLGFVLLDRVEPNGGATVVLAGSHRRMAVLADALDASVTTDVALARLAEEEPWFAELIQAHKQTPQPTCASAGIGLRIQPLEGEAGDVVFMNPRCLHTTSANTSSRPRLLMRMTCVRADRSE